MNSDGKKYDDLITAGIYIQKYVKKYSLCDLMWKDKYGTLRFEYMFPPGCTLNWSIDLPFYKKKTRFGDLPYILFHWPSSWLYRRWTVYGRWVARRAIRKACLKWPYITNNIMEHASIDLDFPEYIQDMYWTKYTGEKE